MGLLAAIIDPSSEGGIASIPNLSLKDFGAKNSPVYFVKGTHLSPLQNSKIVTPFLRSFVSLNLSRSVKSGLPVTFRCLYNVLILSRFTFCLNRSVDVVSVVSGSMNDV